MSIITAANNTIFRDSSIVFSKVKRFLSTYNSANLIDEGEFSIYAKEILKDLGLGVFKESDALLRVKNYKAKLPKNFEVLYAAYKCTPFFNAKDTIHPQSTTSVFNDVTWELLEGGEKCEIDCCKEKGIIEKITVRQYVEEKTITSNLTNPVLLRLSPNVKKNKCAEDCENLLASSPYEITLDNGFVITNFNEDFIYMKFYEFPFDENGLPLIPNIDEVEKAIEWYIINQCLLKWHYNKEVSDIAGIVADSDKRFSEAFASAKFVLKLPSFSEMVNYSRRQRSTNLLMLISQQG